MPASPINKGKPRFCVNTTVVFFIYSEFALYSENTSITLTIHLGRDCRPINKQKKVHLNASTQMDLFYLFIVLLVKRKLFNNCSDLTLTYCSTTFTKLFHHCLLYLVLFSLFPLCIVAVYVVIISTCVRK